MRRCLPADPAAALHRITQQHRRRYGRDRLVRHLLAHVEPAGAAEAGAPEWAARQQREDPAEAARPPAADEVYPRLRRPLRQPPVLNTFSHNPTVQQLTASSFVLGHIGCGNETKSPQVCHNGSTCTSNQTWCHSPGALSTGASAAGRSCDNPHWTGLRHATSSRGPWQAVSMSGQEDCGLQVDGGADAW